jgi:hypothetical protein
MPRIVAIAGSRKFHDRSVVTAVMERHVREGDVIWTGGTSGVEVMAAEQARAWGMDHEIYAARWRDAGGDIDPGASYRRYLYVAENCDVIIYLSDGEWTSEIIAAAIECGCELHVYPVKL